VMGMADAKYALEVAAAGGHHVLLSGPKRLVPKGLHSRWRIGLRTLG
jgi:hypothetical protein